MTHESAEDKVNDALETAAKEAGIWDAGTQTQTMTWQQVYDAINAIFNPVP